MESKNMKMWLFRSNLRPLEPYHSIEDIETFKKECHDFYLLQLIWYLENDYIDEAVVWRLRPKDEHQTIKNKHWKVNGKWFSQVWVDNFEECIRDPWFPARPRKADISFFRGGFPEYDKLTKHKNSDLLGIKLYLGAGQRIYPKHGGEYDKFLIEEEVTFGKNTVPFYKTASPNIFYPRVPMESTIYDLCYIANFSQLSYKGQEQFIKQVSESAYLKSLNIVHLGNKPDIGKKLCRKYNVFNIEFMGWVDKPEVNKIINQSKFGLVYSNKTDGCPRVITEILATCTPCLISENTRLLNYYKGPEGGVITFPDNDLESYVSTCLNLIFSITEQALEYKYKISMENICKLNWKNWTKK